MQDPALHAWCCRIPFLSCFEQFKLTHDGKHVPVAESATSAAVGGLEIAATIAGDIEVTERSCDDEAQREHASVQNTDTVMVTPSDSDPHSDLRGLLTDHRLVSKRGKLLSSYMLGHVVPFLSACCGDPDCPSQLPMPHMDCRP